MTQTQPRNGLHIQIIATTIFAAAVQVGLILMVYFNPVMAHDVPFLCINLLAVILWCGVCSSLYRYVRKLQHAAETCDHLVGHLETLSSECSQLRTEKNQLLAAINKLS